MNGQYFGFFQDSKLFDMTNQFIGIVDNEEVWHQNGQYLGIIVESNYILRQINSSRPNRQLIPFPQLQELPPISPARSGKPIPSGWLDALETLSIKRKW
jgi:hypothetical protein